MPPMQKHGVQTDFVKAKLAAQFASEGSQAEQTETEQRNGSAAIRHTNPSDDEREVLVP